MRERRKTTTPNANCECKEEWGVAGERQKQGKNKEKNNGSVDKGDKDADKSKDKGEDKRDEGKHRGEKRSKSSDRRDSDDEKERKERREREEFEAWKECQRKERDRDERRDDHCREYPRRDYHRDRSSRRDEDDDYYSDDDGWIKVSYRRKRRYDRQIFPMNRLKILTINVHGLGSAGKTSKIVQELTYLNCDVVLLQETRVSCKNQAEKFEKFWKGKCFWSFRTGKSPAFCLILIEEF